MEAPLAALRELEMLDRVGDVDLAAFDSGLVEHAIEHPPRRADEGATGQILLIARLLADQHDRGADGAFAEHRLRRVLIERATRAALRLVRSEEHTSELQSLMRISYAVFCLKK